MDPPVSASVVKGLHDNSIELVVVLDNLTGVLIYIGTVLIIAPTELVSEVLVAQPYSFFAVALTKTKSL